MRRVLGGATPNRRGCAGSPPTSPRRAERHGQAARTRARRSISPGSSTSAPPARSAARLLTQADQSAAISAPKPLPAPPKSRRIDDIENMLLRSARPCGVRRPCSRHRSARRRGSRMIHRQTRALVAAERQDGAARRIGIEGGRIGVGRPAPSTTQPSGGLLPLLRATWILPSATTDGGDVEDDRRRRLRQARRRPADWPRAGGRAPPGRDQDAEARGVDEMQRYEAGLGELLRPGPIRPRWPVLRMPRAARPVSRALAISNAEGLLADHLAETQAPVHGDRKRRLVHHHRPTVGQHHALLQPGQVLLQPDHAMRIVADQVGQHQVLGDRRGFGRLAARRPRTPCSRSPRALRLGPAARAHSMPPPAEASRPA